MFLKDYLNKTKKYANADGDDVLKDGINKNLVTAGIGAGLGLVFGVTRKQNLVVSAVIGAIVTVSVFHIIKPKIK
jgi:hypothetical protein